MIVPDIVHYIQLEQPELDFVTLVSIMSTVRNHQPKLILLHSDQETLQGKYWQKLLQLNASQSTTIIKMNLIQPSGQIFGKKMSWIQHVSDVVRIQILKTFGGIYLDNDVYVVKSLQHFRRFEFSIGWPENEYLGN